MLRVVSECEGVSSSRESCEIGVGDYRTSPAQAEMFMGWSWGRPEQYLKESFNY